MKTTIFILLIVSGVAHGARDELRKKMCLHKQIEACPTHKLELKVCMLIEAVRKLDEEIFSTFPKAGDLECSARKKKLEECLADFFGSCMRPYEKYQGKRNP